LNGINPLRAGTVLRPEDYRWNFLGYQVQTNFQLKLHQFEFHWKYLNISYQVLLLQPYHKNITSTVVKTPKLYWTDIGILRQMTGFKGDVTGQLYETMVVGEMIKWIRTWQRDTVLYFYRTRSGMEVDLFLETEHGLIGIEIKSRTNVSGKDIRPLREIAGRLGERWSGGLVVYMGKKIFRIAEPNIWAVPSRRLFQATGGN
jgi:predicted AAA+ superfamily ATPase